MRGFVLSQLRRGGGRLLAAGIAIALGSAFVAAALLGSQIVRTTAYNAVSASYANADLVVSGEEGPLSEEQLASVADAPEVEVVSPVVQLAFEVEHQGRADYAWGAARMSDPRLESAVTTSGSLPASDAEIALAGDTAKRLGLQVGDELSIANFASFDEEPARWTVTLTGLLVDPAGFNFDSPVAIVTDSLATQMLEARGEPALPWRALVLLEDDSGLEASRDTLAEAIPGVDVQTVEELAHETVMAFSGQTDVLTGFVLTFAGISLVVASIVIANTFQVLVAQRAQTLALLRCVGATRRQVRGSVLLEASIVGLVASAVGLAIGVLLAQSALWIVPTLELAVPVPSVIELTPAAVIWPIAAGTLVTVLAALAPARVATRVAPLAALRPLELQPVRGSSKVRLVLALLGVVVGGGILAAATFAALATDVSDPSLFVLAGIFGGAVSITGVLIGAVYFVPGAARWLGLLAHRFGGVPGKVAAANSVRNPRRTTATASALLIGAGLVTMMSTGAATARDSLDSLLDENFPVDIAVNAPWDMNGPGELTDAQLAAVESTEGVARVAPVLTLMGTASTGGDTWSDSAIYTIDEEAAQEVARGGLTLPSPGTIAAPQWMDVPDGQTISLTVGSSTIELEHDAEAFGQLWLASQDFERLGGSPVTSSLWIGLEPGANPEDVVSSLRDTLTDLSSSAGVPIAQVEGAAVERAGYQEVIDTMLAIVIGLLGVAVIIAIVGVANTLSLSVIERRRESATLRAIGLKRGQLRGMLAIEGVIIAVVGAALGAVLGLVYGWAGSTLLLASSGGLRLAVPWRDLAIILVVALAAGLLASVLPSRTATRTPPVAALAVD